MENAAACVTGDEDSDAYRDVVACTTIVTAAQLTASVDFTDQDQNRSDEVQDLRAQVPL